MSVFLTKIQINKIFHLENISIDIDSLEKKHLILTGKNGSGKTSLLNAIAKFLQQIKQDTTLNFQNYRQQLVYWQDELKRRKNGGLPNQIYEAENMVKQYEKNINFSYGQVELTLSDIVLLANKIQEGNFLLSFYSATRKTEVVVPRNPDKPNLKPVDDIKQSKIGEFLKFLVDLKVQEALARNENQTHAADNIKEWFINFTALLGELFEGDQVSLDFNYKDYSFTINQNGRKFGFNELSDGYSAIVDIVADLIIKMQGQDTLTRAYEMEGIVLIDEIETHLHLKLQRLVLPMLTKIFPNIQFIVTTHSPFILNSIPNAVAFDLEKNVRLEDLTEYSYEALTEGYFKVETESSFLLNKLDRFKELSEINEKDAAEQAEYDNLDQEFSSMDDLLTPPNIKGQYLQIKLVAK